MELIKLCWVSADNNTNMTVAIKRYKMGRYVITAHTSKSTPKPRINEIRGHKRQNQRGVRKNLTYRGNLTKYQVERRVNGAIFTAIILIIIMAGYTVNFYAHRSFSIINDQVVPEKSEAAKSVESTRTVLVDNLANTSPVEQYIREEAPKHNIKVSTALRIAKCESTFNPKAKNPNGTASGVYQFINRTWRSYCSGSVFNYKDNINCFMDQYPKHPEWWNASKSCWGKVIDN